MNVGIVCEGRTDFILLEQVVLAVFGPSDIRPLQPVRDALDPTRWSEAGWTQVRRWCEARGAGGITDELEMGGLDVIVLQVDGDLRGQQGMPSTRAALRDHIKAAWIGPPAPPPTLSSSASRRWRPTRGWSPRSIPASTGRPWRGTHVPRIG